MQFRTVFLIGLLIIAPAGLRAADGAAPKLDMHRIVEVTGGKGQFDEEEGTFKVSMPRTDLSVTVGGVRVTPPPMLEDEVQPVLKRLRSAEIHVVALHNHMTAESPRIFFLHYWGIGPTAGLAKGLKAALDVSSGPAVDTRANASRELVIDFESSEPGKPPVGFTTGLTGKGVAADSWTVVEDDTAPRGAKALAQVS
ncbi:MAG: DUF1259 domain-containing protein, partial [Candidatus Binatia bacterium]